jgi:acetyl esterase/lipase
MHTADVHLYADKCVARFDVIAEIDAFLDDSVDMYHRLQRLGVTSSLHVCHHTPHGFLGMGKLFAEVLQHTHTYTC